MKTFVCDGHVFTWIKETVGNGYEIEVKCGEEVIGTATFDHNMEQAHATFPTHTTSINYFNMVDKSFDVAYWIAAVSFCD